VGKGRQAVPTRFRRLVLNTAGYLPFPRVGTLRFAHPTHGAAGGASVDAMRHESHRLPMITHHAEHIAWKVDWDGSEPSAITTAQ
jgi:hypothetical protein